MIEIVSESKCVRCNLCVKVCPTHVFDSTADGLPVIARQSDCQTCYACEVYCPAAALYVAPESQPVSVDEAALREQGLIGSYRESVGWGPGRTSAGRTDKEHVLHRLLNHMIR